MKTKKIFGPGKRRSKKVTATIDEVTMKPKLKFLPFVTDKSSPGYIFENLVDRGRGLDRTMFTSLFYITLKHGVNGIRYFLNNYPDDTSDRVYERIVLGFPEDTFTDEMVQTFTSIGKYLDKDLILDESVKNMGMSDVMSFILAMTKAGRSEEVYGIDFGVLLKYEEVLNHLQDFVKLSNTGAPITFTNTSDIRSYLLYKAAAEPIETQQAVKIIYSKLDTPADDIPF